MFVTRQVAFVFVCLVAVALAAPTELTMKANTTTPASSSNGPTNVVPMAMSHSHSDTNDTLQAHFNTSSTVFTCRDHQMGYYAAVEFDCKAYFFCMPGTFNDMPVFQRVTYLCVNDTRFDQKELDCVSKPSVACDESASYFDSSNEKIRSALNDTSSLN